MGTRISQLCSSPRFTKKKERKEKSTIHPPLVWSSERRTDFRTSSFSLHPIIYSSHPPYTRNVRIHNHHRPRRWYQGVGARFSSATGRRCTHRGVYLAESVGAVTLSWHFTPRGALERALVGTFGINVMAPSRPSPLFTSPLRPISTRSVNPWLTPVIGLVLVVVAQRRERERGEGKRRWICDTAPEEASSHSERMWRRVVGEPGIASLTVKRRRSKKNWSIFRKDFEVGLIIISHPSNELIKAVNRLEGSKLEKRKKLVDIRWN